MGAGARVARYLVPGILCLVAVTQIYLAHFHNLTPWKGGGFGMFASIDGLESRPVHVTIVSGGTSFVVDPRALLPDDRAYQRVQALPNEAQLRRLADLVLARRWIADPEEEVATEVGDSRGEQPGSQAVLMAVPASSRGSDRVEVMLNVDSVRVEVFRIVFDPATSELSLKSLARLDA